MGFTRALRGMLGCWMFGFLGIRVFRSFRSSKICLWGFIRVRMCVVEVAVIKVAEIVKGFIYWICMGSTRVGFTA